MPQQQQQGPDYLPKPAQHEKHLRYRPKYQPGDTFWGVGIEREFYLESAAVAVVSRRDILARTKRERYSVDYYTSYKPGAYKAAVEGLLDDGEEIEIPILINSHALARTDVFGTHQTTYEREPKPNPRFSGETIFERLMRLVPEFFVDEYDQHFYFDGDAVEILTQNFYKATVEDAVEELIQYKTLFLDYANAALEDARPFERNLPLAWAEKNYGFAQMYTNPGGISIFNNGTYQFNLTAPTALNAQGQIADVAGFVRRHQRIIRAFQWIEPFLIAIYGSGDPLAAGPHGYKFAKGSQRSAMSRYIGVGTYDSQRMENGKMLTISAEELPAGFWYEEYHKESGYQPLRQLGLDINFNKHLNHGIEFRIFEWFPESCLLDLLKTLVYLMDQAGGQREIPDPRTSAVWNRVVARAVQSGPFLTIWKGELAVFSGALGLSLGGFEIRDIWRQLQRRLKRWAGRGECSRVMIRRKPSWFDHLRCTTAAAVSVSVSEPAAPHNRS